MAHRHSSVLASALGRRTALARTGGYALAAIAGVLAAREAAATPETARDWLAALVKGEARDGRIVLLTPEVAENGNAVPATITVESEMSAKSYVKALHVAADGNPNPGVASFRFTPLAGRAEVQLRMRLAQTQKVIAVAEMSDGALFVASREVKVTAGGCGG